MIIEDNIDNDKIDFEVTSLQDLIGSDFLVNLAKQLRLEEELEDKRDLKNHDK